LPKLALGAAAALAAINLSPGSAQAYVVTVNSVQYDVTYFTGSYSDNLSQFNTADMPWWGDSSTASVFAQAVGTNLGTPYYGRGGPHFAVANNYYSYIPAYFVDGSVYDTVSGATLSTSRAPSESTPYATATLFSSAPATAPGPLPLLGAGAAFGFSRKLRKRIKLAPVALGSSLPRA
jgi:hypothetical protein